MRLALVCKHQQVTYVFPENLSTKQLERHLIDFKNDMNGNIYVCSGRKSFISKELMSYLFLSHFKVNLISVKRTNFEAWLRRESFE